MCEARCVDHTKYVMREVIDKVPGNDESSATLRSVLRGRILDFRYKGVLDQVANASLANFIT